MTGSARNGHNWTDRYPLIVEAARRIKTDQFIVDGEAMLLGIDGISDFRWAVRRQAEPANGAILGFAGSSPEQVKAWHDVGIVAGGTPIEDPPGIREAAAGKLYVAYLVTSTATKFAPCTAWADMWRERDVVGPQRD